MTEIVGTTIKEIRPMTQAELTEEGWEGHRGETLVIILSNGVKLYPSSDYEGNSGGVWFGKDKEEAFAL